MFRENGDLNQPDEMITDLNARSEVRFRSPPFLGHAEDNSIFHSTSSNFHSFEISLHILSKRKSSPSNGPSSHGSIRVIYLIDRWMHVTNVFVFREGPSEWGILVSDHSFAGQLSMIIPAGCMGPTGHAETEINSRYVDLHRGHD